MQTATEIEQDLVLVGGGHAHALVLRMLAMQPVDGVRLTLISPASHTPYSGMLPGLVAGHYTFEEAHIDLARLCQWAGVRFICDSVTSIDTERRQLHFGDRPALAYDWVSLDIGSQPVLDTVPGAREHAVPVKPVARLWRRWQEGLAEQQMGRALAVVGGGAGGVELMLAMAHTLRDAGSRFALYCGGELLPGYHPLSRRAARMALAELGVDVLEQARVDSVEAGILRLTSGDSAQFDVLYWCTAAAPAGWVAESGLATDERGFMAVTDTLQSIDDPRVFGAGDIATQIANPRPKAGVYAVRQGPVLAHNLRAAVSGNALREHRPQRRFLSILSLGDRRATAQRGLLSISGAWVWRWKDRIDREFMNRFIELPPRPPMPVTASAQVPCGGCGAKVGGDPLRAALAALHDAYPAYCLPAGSAAEDAVPVPIDGTLVQSVDALRALVDDPYVMGQIAAQHALSDLYACAAEPHSALASITIPFASAAVQERDLRQVLAGALSVFADASCVMLGGHSLQGPEWQVGFTVNGRPGPGGILGKRDGQPGDQLVLTAALGTGVLFAAHMQLAADGRDIAAAIAAMVQGNAPAMAAGQRFGATASTDVTGFGLAGHLCEMLDDRLGARLQLARVPVLAGAEAALAAGIRSTLSPANRQAFGVQVEGVSNDPPAELLFDPQTSGGLLLALPPDTADACVAALREQGVQAACIGELTDDHPGRINLL